MKLNDDKGRTLRPLMPALALVVALGLILGDRGWQPAELEFPPKASMTRRMFSSRTVGLPASRSTMKRTPTPAASAN